MPPLRVGFAGTPEFAETALVALVAAGFAVPVVLSQPDRPRGRGLRLEPSPVKRRALALAIPVLQPATLRTEEARAPLLAIPLDVLVVAAYGLILPPAVLAWPRHGCLNIHASLLPRWRGAAPIQRAIEAGDATTGITIMQMDPGLDTGPMVARVEVGIAARETAGSLLEKLADAGATAIVDVLRRLAKEGALTSVAQPVAGSTYAAKVDRSDAAIDWRQTATLIDRKVRAFDPVPGVTTSFGDETFKIWSVLPRPDVHATDPPGTVVGVCAEGIDVACGDGVVRLIAVQPAGRKRMSAAAYAAGRTLQRGAQLAALPQEPGASPRET